MSRCVCGHPDETHRHYRPGSDCGACGRGVCPWFVDLADRDEAHAMMTAGQRIRLAESDAAAHQIIASLIEFTPGYRERALALAATIPAQRRVPTVATEMERRRRTRAVRARGRRPR